MKVSIIYYFVVYKIIFVLKEYVNYYIIYLYFLKKNNWQEKEIFLILDILKIDK